MLRRMLAKVEDDMGLCQARGGRVHVHGRHTETYEAGDAYYAPPGHTPHLYAGSEVVEFHPTAELTKTMEIVEKNMAAMSQDA